jgi:hypothetical protein
MSEWPAYELALPHRELHQSHTQRHTQARLPVQTIPRTVNVHDMHTSVVAMAIEWWDALLSIFLRILERALEIETVWLWRTS